MRRAVPTPLFRLQLEYATRGGDFYQGIKEIDEGDPRRNGRTKKDKKTKRFPRRATKDGKGPLRGWRGLERGSPRNGEKGFQRTGKGKKISTKGHEGRQRATKALEGAQEGFAKVRQGEKGFPPSGSTKDGKRQKDYPRRATKRQRATKGLGSRGGSRGVRQGRFTKRGQKDIHEGPRRTAKGH